MPARPLALAVLLLAASAAPVLGDAAELPDLTGRVWPTDVTPNATIHLYGFVENAVDAPRTGPFDVTLHVNGTLLETQRLAGLGPGEQVWFTSAANATLGEENHTFELRVDVHDEVPEAREDNNAATEVVLFTHRRPDLSVQVLHARVDGWPQPRVTVWWLACNGGNRTSGDVVRVTGTFHGHGIPGLTPGALAFPPHERGPLAPGACASGTAAVDAPHDLAGYRTVTLRVDAEGGDPVRERTLANNRASRNVWMGPGREPALP